MLANNIRFGEVRAAEQRLWTTLGERAGEVIGRINTDPAFVDRLATHALKGAFVPTESQSNAQVLMGHNMVTVEDLLCLLDLRPTNAELDLLATVPFSEERLTYTRYTHVLVPVLGRSLVELRLPLRDMSEVYKEEVCDTRWVLLRKNTVEGSNNLPFEIQERLLSSAESIPSARETAYCATAYFKKRKEYLFKSVDPFTTQFVRTATLDQGGQHVLVSTGLEERVSVVTMHGIISNDAAHPNFGLAACYY